MLFRRRRPEPQVTPVRFLPLHRASHGKCVAYGRTPEEAVARWKRQHKPEGFSVWDIPDAIATAVFFT